MFVTVGLFGLASGTAWHAVGRLDFQADHGQQHEQQEQHGTQRKLRVVHYSGPYARLVDTVLRELLAE